MNKGVYKWQGIPVKVKFGTVRVTEMPGKPLYWYNYEVLGLGIKNLPAVQIEYQESKGAPKQIFCIANHFGIGVRKLEDGGYPNLTHLSLPNDFTEYSADEWATEKFKALTEDMPAFREHEKARDKWQAKKYPVEHMEREKIFLHRAPVRLWEIK